MFGSSVVYGRGVANYNQFKFGKNKSDKDEFKAALSRYQNSSKNSAAREEFVNAINNLKNSGSDIGKEFKELFKLSNSILSSMRGNSYWADKYEEIGSRLLLVKAAVKAGVERNDSVYFDRGVTNQDLKGKLRQEYHGELARYNLIGTKTNWGDNKRQDKFRKELITLHKAMLVYPDSPIYSVTALLKLKQTFCKIYEAIPHKTYKPTEAYKMPDKDDFLGADIILYQGTLYHLHTVTGLVTKLELDLTDQDLSNLHIMPNLTHEQSGRNLDIMHQYLNNRYKSSIVGKLISEKGLCNSERRRNQAIANFKADAATLLKLMPQDKESIVEFYQDCLMLKPSQINHDYIPELLDVLRDKFSPDEINLRVAGFLQGATKEERINVLTRFQRELKNSTEDKCIRNSFNQFMADKDYTSAAKIAEIFGEELGEQAITDFLIKCSEIDNSSIYQYSAPVSRIVHHERIVEIMQKYIDILSPQSCATIINAFATNCSQTKVNGNWQCVLNVFKVLECAREKGKIDVNAVEESVSQLLQKCEPELEGLVNYCTRSTEVDLDNIKCTFNVLKTVDEIISSAKKDAESSTDLAIIANCESRKQSINELRCSLATYCINSGNKQAIDIGKAMNSAVPI